MLDNPERRAVADTFARRFAPPELYDPAKRREWKLGRNDEDRGPYVIELNLQHIEGLSGALATLQARLKTIATEAAKEPPEEKPHTPAELEPPEQISKTYVRCMLNVKEWQDLLALDDIEARKQAEAATAKLQAEALEKATENTPPQPVQPIDSIRFRAIYKLWPDFPVQSQIYKSVATIKADAALRSFDAAGTDIVWAVIDSGIDGNHPHFQVSTGHTLDSPDVHDLHRCFVASEGTIAGIQYVAPAPKSPEALQRPPEGASQDDFLKQRQALIEEHRLRALTDDFGHGTHVAGIIAGSGEAAKAVHVLERVDKVNEKRELERGQFKEAAKVAPKAIRGMAPNCRLISLRVLDANGEGRSSDVIRALDYVREKLNDNPKLLRVHGVNLSVGYEFDPEMFACGQSPICAEVNRLVQSGVVVVAAAGNTGFGTVAAAVRPTKVGLSNTINDPGNAEYAITVGATHRDSPHTYGVSYFSSKGPTGDGRLKPDLVAPGERITSCGAGKRLEKAKKDAGQAGANGAAYYVEDSGTSMAAPHVSGAIAAFLSIRREYIGQPLEVKKIFLSTATPLGRERYFEGNGLIDLIRAIQSV